MQSGKTEKFISALRDTVTVGDIGLVYKFGESNIYVSFEISVVLVGEI